MRHHDAIRAAYKEAFAAVKIDLQFTVREAEEAGDMAWLRSVSKGTVKMLKTGVETKQGYNFKDKIPIDVTSVPNYNGYVTHSGVAESQGRQWRRLAAVE